MRFRNSTNRNNQFSGMNNPYDYRQNRHRARLGGNRFSKQEYNQSEGHGEQKDKNNTDDFVVLSLEEIRNRKASNPQENRSQFVDQKVSKEDKSERLDTGESPVEAPDYEMSEEETNNESLRVKNENMDTKDLNNGDWNSEGVNVETSKEAHEVSKQPTDNESSREPNTLSSKNFNPDEDNNQYHNPQTTQDNDVNNPWAVQDQAISWRNSDKNSDSGKRADADHSKNAENENSESASNDYNRRVTKRLSRDSGNGYYNNNSRHNIREDDRNFRDSMQRSSDYRDDYSGRQNQNAGYERNYDRNTSYNKSWNNNWRYNKNDSKQQNSDAPDSYQDSLKQQSGNFSSNYQTNTDYDANNRDNNRAGGPSRLTGGNYVRKYMRFNNQTPRTPYHTSSTPVSGDELDTKKYSNRSVNYESNFQRNTNRKPTYLSNIQNKDSYQYQMYSREGAPRYENRYGSKPAHTSHNYENDNEQQDGRVNDTYHRGIRTIPIKRPKTYNQRDGAKLYTDDSGNRYGTYEQDSVIEGSSDSNNKIVTTLERDIMLQPFASAISNYMRLIDSDKEVSLDICKKILTAASLREEAHVVSKVFSYMQQEYRDVLKQDEYLSVLQCYAAMGDVQNIKVTREYASMFEINISATSWANILLSIGGTSRLTSDVVKVIIDSILKAHITQNLIPYAPFLLQVCLDNFLTEESLAVFNRFVNSPPAPNETVFDTQTLSSLLKFLLDSNEFKSGLSVIQQSCASKHVLHEHVALQFIINCLYKRDQSYIAKQAYLIIRKHCRFGYKNLKVLQDIAELFSTVHLITESITVIKDITSSILPITDPEILITLLNNVSTDTDRNEVIGIFKHLLSHKLLSTSKNSRLYEGLTRLIVKSGTPENIIWFKNHLIVSCISATPSMEKLLSCSDRSFVKNSEAL